MVLHPNTFISQINPPEQFIEPALWFIFKGDDILLHHQPTLTIPRLSNIAQLNLAINRQLFMGMSGNTPCFTAQVDSSQTTLPIAMEFHNVRHAHEVLNDEAFFLLATRAKQLLHWDHSTQFCGYCGKKTQLSEHERAKVCSACKALIFPQISPVMLALVWRDNEILLARSPHFMPGVYSILAGFVEPGETLEHTVIREVKEEVGVNIKNLQYISSQPWPFVSNLMLGFIAEYQSGELEIDETELEDAQWFSIDKLPPLPKPISLSRRIIDGYLTSRSNLK